MRRNVKYVACVPQMTLAPLESRKFWMAVGMRIDNYPIIRCAVFPPLGHPIGLLSLHLIKYAAQPSDVKNLGRAHIALYFPLPMPEVFGTSPLRILGRFFAW